MIKEQFSPPSCRAGGEAFFQRSTHMKKIMLILAIISALCLLLAACDNGGATNETTADTSKETETAAPRYDYMGADVASDVELDEADYKGVTITISNSYMSCTISNDNYSTKSKCSTTFYYFSYSIYSYYFFF